MRYTARTLQTHTIRKRSAVNILGGVLCWRSCIYDVVLGLRETCGLNLVIYRLSYGGCIDEQCKNKRYRAFPRFRVRIRITRYNCMSTNAAHIVARVYTRKHNVPGVTRRRGVDSAFCGPRGEAVQIKNKVGSCLTIDYTLRRLFFAPGTSRDGSRQRRRQHCHVRRRCRPRKSPEELRLSRPERIWISVKVKDQ